MTMTPRGVSSTLISSVIAVDHQEPSRGNNPRLGSSDQSLDIHWMLKAMFILNESNLILVKMILDRCLTTTLAPTEPSNFSLKAIKTFLRSTKAVLINHRYHCIKENDDNIRQNHYRHHNDDEQVTPSLSINEASFTIRVRDQSRLDYEALKEVFFITMMLMIIIMMLTMTLMQVNFTVVAREVAAGGRESRASVVVHVRDLNDNPPIFLQVQTIISKVLSHVKVSHHPAYP